MSSSSSGSNVSVFSECSDYCGWVAAVVCVLAWGSFGVPIKTNVKVEVHPLIMQSYKTIVCFVTSWLVIYLGEEVRWSNWGIVSGLFWVPGAACGIYGIRNAGIAVAVGTWSSINVLSSLVFGLAVFNEGFRDISQTCLAFAFLIVGLIGMSRYSAHQPSTSYSSAASTSTISPRKHLGKPPPNLNAVVPIKRSLSLTEGTTNADNGMSLTAATTGMLPLEMEPLVQDDEAVVMGDERDAKDGSNKDRLVYCGGRISLTRRQMGILGAVINGAWGGMNLIPLHFALRDDGLTGAGYLISYGAGSLIVNTAIWILLIGYHLYQKKGNIEDAVDCLPKWHIDQLWLPGLMAGLLYSLGNFASILAVTYLGQGTGFSFCQMQLFVSGLWGVFYFREIKGTRIIIKWFLSALVAVVGIIWLSYEHEGGAMGHR